MANQKFLLKKSAIFLGTVFIIITLLYVFRGPLLVCMGKFLVVEDPLSNADIIYLLTGEVASRPSHAAKLYRENYTNTIIVPQHELIPAENLGIYPNPTDKLYKPPSANHLLI